MTNNNYHEERINNRLKYLDEKKALERKHERLHKKLAEKIAYLRNSIDIVLNDEKEISKNISKRKGLLDILKKVRDPYSDFYDESRFLMKIGIVPPDHSPEKFRYAKKKTEKGVIEMISDVERPLKNYFENLILGVNELFRISSYPINPVQKDSLESLKKILTEIKEVANIKDYDDFKNIIYKLKMELKENFLESSANYQKSLASFGISTKDKMQGIALLNISLLEKECNKINEETSKRRSEYFNSLEGIVLAYATYQIELENTKDEDYTLFLLDNVDNNLSILQNKEYKEVMSSIRNLFNKGNISKDEYIILERSLEKELKKELEFISGDKKYIKADTIGEIRRRAGFIADYKIPLDKALQIAKLIKDENLIRLPRQLANSLETNLAELLIQNNPELFLMGENDAEKYIGKFKEISELVKRFRMINDFDPYTTPKNFASFDSLEETKEKFYNFTRETRKAREETMEVGRVEIGDIDNIRLDLEREGFNPDLTLSIIRRGFYFHGKYYTGKLKRNIERIEESIRKDHTIQFDKKEFDKEFKRLCDYGAIEFQRGYSLNPHAKKINSAALRRAINYMLTHHPLEE